MTAVVTSLGCAPDAPRADLAITGATVRTMDADQPVAQALAVRDGRIVYVGDDAGARALVGPDTRVIDAGERLVLPGFIDAHVHPISGYGLTLGHATTVKAVEDAVADYVLSHPNEAWVEGYGWDLNLFPPGGPDRAALDSLVPDRPALIWGGDGHSVWANSRALAAAGIDADTPDPAGGRIERDADGTPSGTLRETAATLLERVVPTWSLEKRLDALERSLDMMRRFGITGFLDAAIDDQAMLDVYLEAGRRGLLNAHAALSLALPREAETLDVGATVARLEALRERARAAAIGPGSAGRADVRADGQGGNAQSAGDVSANTVKIFVDGVIEAGTAAMLEPYTGTDGDRGELLRGPAALDTLTKALHAAGFQLHYHAIGDRAIREVLDAIEAADITARTGAPFGTVAGRSGRPLLAHVQVVDPADVDRFAELGAIPVFQTLWAYADAYITDLTIPRLGPERSRAIYPVGTLLRAGATLAMGSDWPVTSMDPLRAIEVAVTRIDPDLPADASVPDSSGAPPFSRIDPTQLGPQRPFLPAERISVADAVRAYTLGSARATLRDDVAGSITIGKRADVIMLSADIFTIDPRHIAEARVMLTLHGGRELYRDSTFR